MDFDVVTIPTSSQTPKNLDGDFYPLSMSFNPYISYFR